MTRKSEGKAAEQEQTFEQALERLNQIVAELEADTVSLDQSLRLFAEGKRLAEFCHAQLAAAEHKVKTLLKSGEGFTEEIPGGEPEPGR